MKTKKISSDEALKLLGLFTLANEAYSECRKAELAINRALKRIDSNYEDGYCGHISDAVVGGRVSATTFYEALAKEGFTVLKK